MKPKTVLIFILNGLGGAEKVQIQIAKFLQQDGWNIHFCRICYKGNDNIIQKFYPNDVKSSSIKFYSQFNFIKQLYHEISTIKPSVVFASAMHINQRILFLSPLFPKIKFVVRNDNGLYTIPKWKQSTLRITYKSADKIITQTEEMENELISLGIKKEKIQTLHNPVNITQIKEKALLYNPYEENNSIKFVAVGRFAKQKGFDVLIEAFKLVVKELPESELYIVGDTAYGNSEVANELNELISKYQLSGKVFFPGFQDNPYPYVANADVFVLSSRYEGLPNSLIEALALGKPCAATKCIPIISRIIQDGKNGFLATSENPKELADAMIAALKIKEVENTYAPTRDIDFIRLFNNLI